MLAVDQDRDAVILLQAVDMAAHHRFSQRHQPIIRVDLVPSNKLVELHERSRRDVLGHLEVGCADDVGRIGAGAQGACAIRARRIDDDAHFDVGVQPLELGQRLRLGRGARVVRIGGVEKGVVGDFDLLGERDRRHRHDDRECGDEIGDALPGAAACSAALRKRVALVHWSHRFLRCGRWRVGSSSVARRCDSQPHGLGRRNSEQGQTAVQNLLRFGWNV
jgi:hypothetical protein